MTDAAPDPAGWALLADRTTPGVAASLERFGSIYRHPLLLDGSGLDGSGLADPRPGQPCILLSLDRSRVAGLWAIGEVVADPLDLPAGFPWTPAERPLLPDDAPAEPPARRWAEVELLLLDKPVAFEALASVPGLAGTSLVDPAALPPVPGPVPLTAAQVRAIESLDTWLDEPTDAQRTALDELLAAEDALLPEP